jgi:hypothetical protein
MFLISTSSNLSANIKIAFIDTGFCPDHADYKAVHILKYYDATNSLKKLNCPAEYLNYHRFHGENVIKVFLDGIDPSIIVELQPIIVFDQSGKQKKSYWENAFKFLSKFKPDVIISASGLIGDKLIYPNDLKDSVWFLSAPRISPEIKMNDEIYPQFFYDKKNVFLVGSKLSGGIVDPGMLYQKAISFYANDPEKGFNGTSYAVANISSYVISTCKDRLNNLLSCVTEKKSSKK